MSTVEEILSDTTPTKIDPWSVDHETMHLLHDGGPYGIPLDEFRDLADLGRWVHHIVGKSWGTGPVLKALVVAFDELNWDRQ